MRKFLLIVGAILLILFIIDFAVLKDDGMIKKMSLGDKYEKAKNLDELPFGLNNGERAPDFTVKDLNGNDISLSDFRGKKVLLNFWATWCGPCRIEMPYMERIYTESGNEDIAIVAVNMLTTEKNLENVHTFVEDFGLTFPVPVDEDGRLHSLYRIMAYPTSYFLDTDGVIRNKVVGTMDEDYMISQLKKLQ